MYKGSKIEWDNDECAQTLERPLRTRQENIQPKKNAAPSMNRFQLLNMEDDENESQDDADENDSSGITLPSVLKASSGNVFAWESQTGQWSVLTLYRPA